MRSARRCTGAGPLGLLDEADDLGEGGVGAHPGGLHHEPAVGVHRGADDLVAGPDLHGHRLAGDQRGVDRGAPSTTTPSVAMRSPGRTSKRMPTSRSSSGDLAAVDEPGGAGAQLGQGPQGGARPALGPASNHLPSRMSVMITPAVSK
jgi:hypothetical protein